MDNQRIRVTKRMLKDALVSLLDKKDISKIKVQEICATAEINRTTFYKYYGCPQDLLDEIEQEMFEELANYMKPERNSWMQSLVATISYMTSDVKKWKMLINSKSDMDFVEKLFACSSLQDELDKELDFPGEYTPGQMKYIHVFLYSGCYAMLRKWINQEENRESAEEMAALLTSFTAYLRKNNRGIS